MELENLFIYGTLIDQQVQLNVFGRVISGVEDCLEHYFLSTITLVEDSESLKHNTYPMIKPLKHSLVKGYCIAVTKEELKRIDIYETKAYERAMVVLKSGHKAWVYRQPQH